MASSYEFNQENGRNIPMFQNQITDVSLLCASWHARRDNTASKCKTNEKKMRGRGEEEETERGEGREGTLIINATGHRPFKIFKIKKKGIAINNNISCFFLSPVFYMNVISLFEKNPKTQHLK